MLRIHPWIDSEVYPAYKIAALVFALTNEGVDPAAALAGTGLTPEQLQSPDTRISNRQTKQTLLNAINLSSTTTCGFRAGERMRVTSYGMYGYALISSRSHQEALQFALKYHRVMGPVAEMTYAQEGDHAIFIHTPLFTHDPSDDLYRLSMEFQFSSQQTLNRDLHGPTFRFSDVRLKFAAPKHSVEYKTFFGCDVLFSQPQNELRFDLNCMDDIMQYADPITNAMALETCEKGLAVAEKSGGIAGEVYRILLKHPGRFPNIEAVAEAMKTNARNLRRQLSDENSSFRTILTDARMHLAVEYLKNTEMTNEEIATRLGYSEAANFRHALIRWGQHSPSHYRKQ